MKMEKKESLKNNITPIRDLPTIFNKAPET